MATRPLGAQLSHMLKDRGVDTIFGIPGVHNQEMYRGIEEAGITHVLARHEQGAGFMADGYARATGRPGVCYVITGPGLTNIMTPLGQAYSDSVPVLVISSCLDETAARKGQLHQMKDQRAAGETVCDWSEEARTAQAAYQLIDRALVEFETTRPRPKHVQVPISVLEAQAGGPSVKARRVTQGAGTVDDATLDRIAADLSNAARPIVVFGGGLGRQSPDGASARDMEAARAFLAKTGAASFTSYAGRGLVSPDWPLHFGSTLARDTSAEVFAAADYVLAIGTSLDEVDLWRAHLGHNAPLLRVDIDPTVLSDGQEAEICLNMRATDFLEGMNDRLPDHQNPKWNAEEVRARKAQWRAEVDADYPGVLRFADALRAGLPQGTMIYSDMTQFAYAAKEVWDMDTPAHWHHPTGFGTLGYALPAAIGGAVARPNLPTLAIAGDYGFQYTLNELGTAVELGLSLPILLWDNGKLGAIEASMVSAQIAPNAVIARNPDFALLAQAYGAGYAEPATLTEMNAAVSAAFNAGHPTLIRVTPQIAD
ncbi:MAG: thiamine pyrophosphate-binding protein [Paracoccaceae bacterium]